MFYIFKYLLFLNLIFLISSAALHAEEEPTRSEELTRILNVCNSEAFEKTLESLNDVNYYLKNCGQPLIDYLKTNRYDEFSLEAADRCFSPDQSKLRESKYESLFCRKYIQEIFNTASNDDKNEILEKVCSISCPKEDASRFFLRNNVCDCI